MASRKIAVIVGVGPGISSAVAQKFGANGYAVALLARNTEKLKDLMEELTKSGAEANSYAVDATKETEVKEAFNSIKSWGSIEALIYNAGAFKRASFGDITTEEFEKYWRSNCLGGFIAASQVIHEMAARGSGTIIFTGATASLRGSAMFSLLAVGKFGLRALAQSLAREYGPKGVHIAHLIVDGVVDTPTARGYIQDPNHQFISPEGIADMYFLLHNQPKTAWTHELDVRPSNEKW